MNLVIVESSAKAKTIETHLQHIFHDQGTFKVIASLGHVRDLPSKDIGVNTENWTIQYESLAKKRDVIQRLRTAIAEASCVYLASDPDREGEAIAFHLQTMFRIPKNKYKRVTFNEITREAIKHAFTHPRDIDFALVNAQETRRVLDRVVGYELSPLLWQRYCTPSLSAGRVQSTALAMIVQRAEEANKHQAEIFWKIAASFDIHGSSVITSLYYEKEEAKWDNMDDVNEMFHWILLKKDQSSWKLDINHKKTSKNPPAPFITTTLQNEAYSRYGFNAKRTMQLAQTLYEAGHITYMRTDSPALSSTAQNEIVSYIEKQYGNDKICERSFQSKQAHSQEAHECIRPSKVYVTCSDLTSEMITQAHKQLYDLIWRRTIASQMIAAQYKDFHICVQHTKMPRYNFQGSVHLLLKQGFLQVSSPSVQIDSDALVKWEALCIAENPSIHIDTCTCKGDATRGISLYNEPGLIKALEHEGVGRPSTYATIIDKLFDKKYVCHGTNPQHDIVVKGFKWTRHDNNIVEEDITIHLGGTDKDKYIPTSLGQKVISYIQEVYPKLLDVSFTSQMEKQLDDISRGTIAKEEILNAFYHDFHPTIVHHVSTMKEKAKENRGQPKGNKGPTTELKEFPSLSSAIVQTKYGPALYHKPDRRFISIAPYMDWRKKTYEQLDDNDVNFLLSLPCKVDGTSRTVVMGPYGLYVKDGTKNIPLPKENWEHVVNGTIRAETLNNLIVPPKKTVWKKKQSRS